AYAGLHHVYGNGASLSPCSFANIYLHYAFDLWVHVWRRKRAQREVTVLRYADDIVVGFQSEADAKRLRAELTDTFPC
ncbi:MAG TPA: hypothetical protein VND66_09905, partial [Acidobacteriaceae bacterium]|nr:hypothetical protein [Acidobacteriaceae bacterium]